jgi:hypothetical protein
MSKSPFKASGDSFEELSLEEVQDVLSKDKRALGPSVAFATLLQWGDDGIPKVVGIPIRMSQSPAEKLLEALKISLDMPYQGNDPSLQGLSMGWAMNIQEARKAAQGDSAAYHRIMDRLVGAPVQRSQSMNFNGDLSDFLDKVGAQTKEVAIDITADVKDDNSNVEDL